jgi:hypothetical protein
VCYSLCCVVGHVGGCWGLGLGVLLELEGRFSHGFSSARIFCCSLLFWCALLLAYCFGILVSFKKLSMQLKQKYLT